MLEPLTRPFKRHYDKYRGKLNGFVAPVKESVAKLMAMIPKGEAFAGSEDLGQEADGSTSGGKPGLLAKIKDFKKSIKGLSDFQKLILLTIAVVLPAGILIAVVLAKFLRRKK
ncbi:hypothetical protein [Fibrobacter sp. UWP2]|uniref:hypothetical protein n=1 Tax=Fibrobacter sp. UWP2 TaxID=1896216 RepID=UPI00091521BE|nr:hypothetical protein [Fibrobacter sp. UWP2]SHI45771.1 hypothetical protein SAMN05720471_10267 [Fibrobacter sp. UWP2]